MHLPSVFVNCAACEAWLTLDCHWPDEDGVGSCVPLVDGLHVDQS